MAIGMQHVATLPIDHIDVPKGRRPIDPKTVETLVNSIKEIGLQNPITVRHGDNRHILVAGLHRLEALRKLGRDRAPCLVVDMSDVDARLWEIAENLHRSDLTAQERAEQIAQWVRLTEQKGVSAQLAPKPQGGRPESGVSQAARTLKVPKRTAQRSVKIAEKTTPEAAQAARDTGLDDNQRALEEIADTDTDKQVDKVHEIADRKKKAKAKKRAPAATESAEDDVCFLDDDGNYAAVDYKTASISTRTRGFIWRAEQSALAARTDHLNGIPITREMMEGATEAATAWKSIRDQMGVAQPVVALEEPAATPAAEPAAAPDDDADGFLV